MVVNWTETVRAVSKVIELTHTLPLHPVKICYFLSKEKRKEKNNGNRSIFLNSLIQITVTVAVRKLQTFLSPSRMLKLLQSSTRTAEICNLQKQTSAQH